MPKIRRRKLPPQLLKHLLERMRQRNISPEQIIVLARWLDTEPEVPQQRWFRRFPGFILCGEGELIKTFLIPGQAPGGQEIT
jgi:ribosomal protein S18 acetylase RimI-like enzyme